MSDAEPAGNSLTIVPGDLTVAQPSRAVLDVWAERQRQILEEGFTLADDDAHDAGELSRAAACYARGMQFTEMTHRMGNSANQLVDVPVDWPWSPDWWKPRSRREDLVRAGALILAEIERRDRAEAAAAEAAPGQGT